MSRRSKPRPKVTAIRDTRRGLSEDFVPAGSTGQMYGTRHADGTCLIWWPRIRRAYNGDNRMSVHFASDLKFD